MMEGIAALFSLMMAALAALHAYWGLGGVWPAANEKALARMVVGTKDIEAMPSAISCLVVAVALAGIALWPFFLTKSIPVFWPSWLTAAGGAAIFLVFLGRGLISYVPALRFLGPEEPFATLDKRLYAPLCLALAAAMAVLLQGYFTS
jgi:hypothetical protein